jgi:putative peptide zinc metalloprotease protein
VRRAAPLLGLRFRYVVSNPEVTRRVTAPFAQLFHPGVVTVLLGAFVFVAWWVLFRQGLAAATHEAFYRPGMLLAVFAVTVISAGFHEFGHASAARYGGATPGAMGMGLYLVWPAFYTDVTDSYRLGRAGRVRTDLGGLYFNAVVAVAMFGLWWLTDWEAILLIIAAQILQMLRQLAPLVRFDGYHVLADVTGVPDLYRHIKPTLAGLLPHNWGKPEHRLLKPWARAVVSTWVLLVVPLLLGTVVLMVTAFPRVAATAWDSAGHQWAGLRGSFLEGDVAGMGVRLLSVVAIVLPVLGSVYTISRLVRRVSTRVWHSTANHPARRAVAVAAALAIVAGLAWSWWPEGDRYRPIQPYEGGTLLDALPTTASSALRPGAVARATTAWPVGEPLPTADRPALSVVLVPHASGGGAPGGATGAVRPAGDTREATPGTWVFPFNRPPAPGEGDNQALAVNTEDGATVYDVAFALVWADGDAADSVNSAYALASCADCTTVAVAFQVVLVLGSSDVVPQNLAAAVNYSCLTCVTGALAQQLVVTLDGPLRPATRRELADLWSRIAEYGTTLQGRSLAEIRDQLADFERQILATLGVEVSRSSSDSSTTGTTPTSSDGTGAALSIPPSDGASDGATSPATQGAATGATGPSASPETTSQDPTPTPDQSPTEPASTPSPAATESATTSSGTVEPSPSGSPSP